MTGTVLFVGSKAEAARAAMMRAGGNDFSALCVGLQVLGESDQLAIMREAMRLKSNAEAPTIPNGSIRSVREGLSNSRPNRSKKR